MAMTTRNQFAQLQYYLREKLWCQAISQAQDVASALGDYTFLCWKAFALDMSGQASEALREYKACEGKRGVNAAALTGLRIIYKRNNDTESVNQIEQRLSQESDRGNSISGVMQMALMLWHAGETSRARDTINKVSDSDPEYRDEYTSVLLVRGWIDLTSGRGTYIEKCNMMFERVITAESQEGFLDVDGFLGRVAVLERKNHLDPALQLLNKLSVGCPWFTSGHVVRARIMLRLEDWDQAQEQINSLLQRDFANVEALTLSTLLLLVRDARVAQAARSLNDLMKALQQREGRNATLYMTCAQCFSRLAGGSMQILQLTTAMVEAAQQMQPHNAEIISEVAYQHVLRGDFRTAQTLYKQASAGGDGSTTPLLGLIKCAIHNKSLDEAEQQIHFLTEIETTGRNAELLFASAQCLWRKQRDQAKSLEKLDQCVAAHQQQVSNVPIGQELYVKLNPHFCLEVAREYIQHCRTEPAEGGKPDPNVEKTRRILNTLLHHFPGCTEAQQLNSKMLFVSGDVSGAAQMIGDCIRQDQGQAEAFLLQAQILMYQGNQLGAAQSLEQALALEFEVKDLPQFNLLKGTLLMQRGDFNEAYKALDHGVKVMEEQAKALQDGTAAAKQPSTTRRSTIKSNMSVNDQVSLYLNLATCLQKLKRSPEAQEVINDATRIFRDTAQNGRIVAAHAMICARTDIDQALEILRSVPNSSPFYMQARMQMAHLYLTQRGNRRLFAKCYEELVEVHTSLTTLALLGDAYATIQEPEKAINAYERARAMDPSDAQLALKIGRTLVTTHDYHRALRYYRDAVAAEGQRSNLRTDLACLLWRLGQHDKAIACLNDAHVMKNKNAQQDDLASSIERVNLTLLMAKILKSGGDTQQAIETLIRTRVYQGNVLAKARSESSEMLAQQRRVAAQVCLELGDHYLNQHNAEKSIGLFNEALRHDETNDKAMLALAQLYMHRGDLENCEMQCNALLRVQPDCEQAIVMLADLMNRRGRYDDAAFHFHQLLDKKPDNYSAMVHYVQLLRRSGNLKDAPQAYEKAMRNVKPGQKVDPGFSYARGLYYRYTGNSREALTEFNNGRSPKDNPWNQKCVIAMIEVYLNPDNDNIWEDTETRQDTVDNIKSAERLLNEVKDPEKRNLLQGYILIAHKRKDSLERALSTFQEVAATAEASRKSAPDGGPAVVEAMGDGPAIAEESKPADRIHVPALVGMAVCLQLMKQTPKVKNHLKKVTQKQNFNSEEDDDYEKAYLLLAAIQTEAGKHDLAQEQLKRALAANKSCVRAWEAMGLIYEREQSYKDASDCYENAWKLVNDTDASVGYKLAFNYLKAKRFVQAIDVCYKVLDKHPNYPKIRKEVLERARASIRL